VCNIEWIKMQGETIIEKVYAEFNQYD